MDLQSNNSGMTDEEQKQPRYHAQSDKNILKPSLQFEFNQPKTVSDKHNIVGRIEPRPHDSAITNATITTVQIAKEIPDLKIEETKRYPFFSQLNALFTKHNLEWVRTPFQSFYEFLFPLLLFSIAAGIRRAIPIETTDWTLDSFKQASYPVGKVNNKTQQWQQFTFQEKQKFQADVQDFYLYTNLTTNRVVNKQQEIVSVYTPDYDFVGPYFFYPMACYSKTDYDHSLPIIGYVKNDNAVERALIAQYEMVFSSQKDIKNMITQVPAFLASIQKALGLSSEGGSDSGGAITFEQIIGKQGPQIDHDIIIYAGGITQDDAGMGSVEMFGNFTFKEFSSKESLELYLSADDYGTPSKPGMCFGFQITENDKRNKYELEVFANDKWPNMRRLIPDVAFDRMRPYAKDPQLDGYGKYIYNGFHMMENWVANIILQLKTGKPDAKIVSLIGPQLNRKFEADGFTIFLDQTFHYFVLLMYLPVVYRYTFRIVMERQTKNKQLMQSMGMRVLPYWLSWWASYTMMSTAIATICAIISYFGIFMHTTSNVLWVFYCVYGQALFSLVWISSTLFDSPQMACVMLTVHIWSMTVIEFFFDQKESWAPTMGFKILISIVNPIFTAKQTLRNIVTFDNASLEVSWWRGWQIRENYSLNMGVILLLINCIVNNVIAFIMEVRISNIEEKERKFCLCKKKNTSKILYLKNKDEERLETETHNSFIHVSELNKSFGSKNILNSLSITMEDNKIIAIVGANASGKTTFLKELSKQICTELKTSDFDSDSAEDIFGESSKLKIGILPEEIVLFDLLTPIEHLELYRGLKGSHSFDKPGIRKRLTELLKLMGYDVGDRWMPAEVSQLAGTQSEAQKRKLQIAIALCSQPRILLLDDPFSGFDQEQISKFVKVLEDYKNNGEQLGETRLICYTTSSVEVAKLISDRTILLKDGKMIDLDLKVHHPVINRPNEDKINDNLEEGSIGTENIQESFGDQTIQNVRNIDRDVDRGIDLTKMESTFNDVSQIDLVERIDNETPEKNGRNSDELNINRTSPNGEGRNSDELVRNSMKHIIDRKAQSPFEFIEGFKIEDSNEVQYPVSDSKLFAKQVQAVFKRRWRSAVHNKKNTTFQIVAPICVIILGYFSCRSYISVRTPSRVLSPDWYDSVQQITVNEKPIDIKRSDTEVGKVLKNLPMFETNFDLHYANQTQSQDYYSMAEQIYKMNMQANNSNYGSYIMHQINVKDHQYKFVTLPNTTDQQANILFSQFMYEAILKTSIEDPDFEFKTRSTPYPLRPFQKNLIHRSPTFFKTMDYWTFRSYLMNLSRMAEGPIYAFAASYAIAASYVLYMITEERINKQKSLQMVSGLKIASYWIGNYIFDVLILEILVTATILCFVVFDPMWKASLAVFTLWPFTIVMVVYSFSFFFKNIGSTMSFTVTTQLFLMMCCSQLVFNLRILSKTEYIADVTMWVMRLFASFPIVNSLYVEASSVRLSELRSYTKENDNGTGVHDDDGPWSIYNCTGDLTMLLFQMIASMILIVFIELEQIKRIRGACRKRFNPTQEAPDEQPVLIKSNGICVDGLSYQSIEYLKLQKHFTNVSFNVKKGQLLTLVSEQNAHKTALIQTIIHELIPSHGFVYLNGVDMSKVCGEYPPGLIGYCPQKLNLFQQLTVEEQLEYFANIRGIFDKIEVEQLIESLGLDKDRNTIGSKLSVGNSRLVQIAIALLGKPKVLIIDGAFDGLDSESIKLVCQMLQLACKNWNSAVLVGVAILNEELKRISTEVAVINRKRGDEFFVVQHINDKEVQ